MLQYCKNCALAFEGARCPACGSKRTRAVQPEDPCFLTEKEWMWGGMLADVLRQNGIVFMTKRALGAALALETGPMRERVRFYVLHRQMEQAQALVEELFSQENP